MYGLFNLIIGIVILMCIPFTRNLLLDVVDWIVAGYNTLTDNIGHHRNPFYIPSSDDNTLYSDDSFLYPSDSDSDLYSDSDLSDNYSGPDSTAGFSDLDFSDGSDSLYNSDVSFDSSDDVDTSYLSRESSSVDVVRSKYSGHKYYNPCVGTHLTKNHHLHYAYCFQYLDNGIRHYYFRNSSNTMVFISPDRIDDSSFV